MSDRDPVNIMGVTAFPNPDHDKRMIRFIDSEYHTLFTKPERSVEQKTVKKNTPER